MRVLLDTHALLWFLTDDRRLSQKAHSTIADPGNAVQASVGSLWEIAIKASLGKLVLAEPFEELIPAQLAAERIEILPIEMSHLAALRRLPLHHKAPFDRLLIAQAMAEDIPVVTRDEAFGAYAVQTLWS